MFGHLLPSYVHLHSVRVPTAHCEQDSAPRSGGGVGKCPPLLTSTSVRLNGKFFRVGQPMCSLAVWACVTSPSVKQYVVLWGRDSWMRFSTPSYHSHPSRPSDQKVFGESAISHLSPTSASALVPDSLTSGGGFHFLHDGADNVTTLDEPLLSAVNLGRSNGSRALTGHDLVKMLPQPDLGFTEKTFACRWSTGPSYGWRCRR